MSEVGFTVTDQQLRDQLGPALAMSDSDHLVWPDPAMKVLTEDGPRTAAQTAWYLEHGVWVDDLYYLCDQPACINADHLTDSGKRAQEERDKHLLGLVQQDAVRKHVTLASLYKKARQAGLTGPAHDYH